MPGVRQHCRDAVAQGRDAAGTTSEEHRVDLIDRHASVIQQLRNAATHTLQQGLDRRFEQRAAQLDAQPGFDAVQRHVAAVGVGQLDLGFFHFHRQPVPGALFDQLEQAIDTAGVFDVVAHAAQRQRGFLRVHRVDRVPGRQVHVVAGRHVGAALHAAAVAEQRHQALQAQLFVEVGPADVHAAGGEDVIVTVVETTTLGRQAHQREVRGTTADVDDQHQLFFLDGRLVVECRRDRFVLERHIFETDFARHFDQRVFGFLVSQRIVVDEEHRTAQHHLLEFPTGGGFGAALELADEQPEQVLERHRRAEDAGVVLDQLGAEQAFQRAHQPAFVAFQILMQGQATVDRATFLDVEEDHRRQGDLVVFQRDHGVHAGAQPADGGVGRAEVDAAGTGWRGVFHVFRIPVKKRPRSVCQCAADSKAGHPLFRRQTA